MFTGLMDQQTIIKSVCKNINAGPIPITTYKHSIWEKWPLTLLDRIY